MQRTARLFQNGRNQALRIPRDMELPGEEVIITRMPDGSLVVRSREYRSLAAYLSSRPPLSEEHWPDPVAELPVEAVDL